MAINSKTHFLVTAALLLAGCAPKTPESGPASDVSMNSSRTARQLLSGFYSVENGAWRWTAKSFTVQLGVPPGAETKGGKLTLRLVLPEPVAQALHTVTLTAKVNDVALNPESYSVAGEQTYAEDVPAAALSTSPVRVTFSLDKALPPGAVDIRELGIIARQVTLISK